MSRTTAKLTGIAVAALAAIVLLTWLLWPSPPAATALHSGTSRYVVSATIDQPRLGNATVTVDLTARDGAAPMAMPMAGVHVEAVMPLMGLATPALPATATGNGRYTVANVPLMMTGPWELHVSVTDQDGTDDLALPFTVTG